jgi:peroxiredoxin (alkyl hydroperoxide reductase subunit C)
MIREDTLPHPVRIGQPAPNFAARSTCGAVELAQFRGRWVIMFSHPGDFTPVCTSEFVALAEAQPRFHACGAELLGVSVDSLNSHLAWLRSIKDRTGVEVRFPIIEDPTLQIAQAYGMIPEDASDASTVRSTYFIDPEGIVQAITCYPYNVGRSVEEMLRLLSALVATQGNTGLCPEGWKTGDPVLTLAEPSLDQVFSGRSTDWFMNGLAPDGR